MDFVHDKLIDNRKLKVLTVIDEFNSKAVTIYIDRGSNSAKVIKVLEHIKLTNGLAAIIRSQSYY